MLFWPKSTAFPFQFRKDSEDTSRPSTSNNSTKGSISEESLLSEKEIQNLRSRRPFLSRTSILISLFHLILFTIYLATIVSLRTEVHRLRQHGPRLASTPANEAVEWELRKFDANDNEKGPFSGKPREEIDRNWHNLLNSENIIIESKYMNDWGREDIGIASPDGNGFLGTLNVYHELHCIKRVYQYTYPEVYAKDQTPQGREMDRAHKDHCLDFLRQSAMCHGDVGVITFQWSPDSLVPVANSTSHQCVNWEKLDTWTKARTVDMMKPGWLVHPTKGLAYPDRKDW